MKRPIEPRHDQARWLDLEAQYEERIFEMIEEAVRADWTEAEAAKALIRAVGTNLLSLVDEQDDGHGNLGTRLW